MLWNWCVMWMISINGIEGWMQKNMLESGWSKNLINYISRYSDKHQVMFLIEDKETSKALKIQHFVSGLIQRFPSYSMTFQATINSSKRYLVLENSPRSTTLFVLILASESESLSSRLSVPIKFLVGLAGVLPRPKCLIVQLVKEEPVSYEKLLHDLWKKQFLHVTFIEIVDKQEEHHSQAFVHILNPFNKAYRREDFSFDSQLFPRKDSNLYGHEIKSVILKSELMNSEPMLETLSKALNFTSNAVKVNETEYGVFSCNKEKCEGKVAELVHNRVNLDASIEFTLNSSCEKIPYLQLRAVMLGTIKALVPRIVVQRVNVAAPLEAVYALVITVTLTTALQIMPPNCKFEKSFWRPIHLLQIVLGMSVGDPKRGKDKLIFGSVLLACVILSGYLFTILAEISLFVGTELQIDTMEDLNQTNLIPVFNRDVHRLTATLDVNHFQDLRKKAEFYGKNYTIPMCLKDAVTYKNTSCIMLLSRARFWIHNMTLNSDTIKIVDQPVVYGVYNWIVEPGSVYFDRLNLIIQRMVEDGLLDSWGLYGPADRDQNKINLSASGDSTQLRYQLACIIVIGYQLSLIVFIAEVLVDFIRKKNNTGGNSNH